MRKLLFILLALALPVLLLAAEPVREWKSKNGYTIEASYDAARDTDSETVPLIKDGRKFIVQFDKLSQADQDYVNSVRKSGRGLDENPDKKSRGIAVVPVGNQYALLIGVNEYAKPIKSLEYCVNDMKLLAECFQKLGMPKENIILITDDSSVDRRPTGAIIRRQIENITRIMEPGDQLVIAFSGHGVMIEDESYLCPSDTNLKDKDSVVPRKWVFELLEKCKAKQKLFIVDACRDEHSFGGGKALGSARTLADPFDAHSHGFAMLASCSPSQQSWEDPGLKHGVFTYYLVEGLSGSAKDEDGYVTIMSLFHYTSSKTKKYVLNNLNEVQVPMLRQGGEMTDFCIAKVDSVIPIPPTSSTPLHSSQEPRPGARRIEIICGEEFAFHWCPTGTCMTKPIIGRKSDFSPIYGEEYEIKISQGFWMLEHLVTQKQWKAVMGSNPSLYEDDNSPVTNVTWNDCLEFCRKTGLQLPTDDQLKYAMRAGASDTDLIGVGVVNGYQMLHTPNKWGLYKDDYCDILTVPTVSPNGSDRVDHGGSLIRYARISKKQPRRR